MTRRIVLVGALAAVLALVAGCGAPVEESVEASPMGIALARLMGRSLMDRDPAYNCTLENER